jgi:hypothetical protein
MLWRVKKQRFWPKGPILLVVGQAKQAVESKGAPTGGR